KDPGGTAILPSITIDDNSWKELATGEKTKDTLKINGGFQISGNTYLGWLSYDELKGLRWMEAGTKMTPVQIIEDGKQLGVVEIKKHRGENNREQDRTESISQITENGRRKLGGLEEEQSQTKREKLAERQNKEDRLTTYEKALEKDID